MRNGDTGPHSDLVSTLVLIGAAYLVLTGLWMIGSGAALVAVLGPVMTAKWGMTRACLRQEAANERFMREQGLRK